MTDKSPGLCACAEPDKVYSDGGRSADWSCRKCGLPGGRDDAPVSPRPSSACWIPLEKEFPPPRTNFLVYRGNHEGPHVWIAYLTEENFFLAGCWQGTRFLSPKEFLGRGFTHWAPLPGGPDEYSPRTA